MGSASATNRSLTEPTNPDTKRRPQMRVASLAFAVISLAWIGAASPTLRSFQKGISFALAHPALVWSTIGTPGAGLDVLSPRILAAVQLIQDENLKTYRFSAAAAADEWFLQQTTVLAWPSLPGHEAFAPVLFVSEALPPGCAPVRVLDEVTLARCP